MKKTGIFIGILILIGITTILSITLFNLASYKNQIKNTVIEDVDLSLVTDGTYQGSANSKFVKVDVTVGVTDHVITHIDLVKHENGRGQKAEVIVEQVLENQSLKVDTISGATASSKMILEAIQHALTEH